MMRLLHNIVIPINRSLSHPRINKLFQTKPCSPQFATGRR